MIFMVYSAKLYISYIYTKKARTTAQHLSPLSFFRQVMSDHQKPASVAALLFSRLPRGPTSSCAAASGASSSTNDDAKGFL